MKKIKIVGKNTLTGTIHISGAKNSVVALIPAAILTDEVVEINNCPVLSDTENLKKIIETLGGTIQFGESTLKINGKNIKSNLISEELSSKLRASYYFMGALLGRFHHVEIYFPGGCKIGKRPIDIHLKGFEQLGAKITRDGDKYTLDTDNLIGTNIYLDFPSVGATINLILAAVLAKGTTVLDNAAKEPEIVNIVTLLNNMGAKISGAGTDKITIKGVKKLHGAIIETIPDRIEAGTYMMIGAVAGTNLKIDNIIPEHVNSLIQKFNEMGVQYELGENYIILNKSDTLKNTNIRTSVYPGFPTDLGQPMSVVLMSANGISKFKETIYESRFGHMPELQKMGAHLEFKNTDATIMGPTTFIGAEVTASDLRAGAALIIAGLIAEGTTKISNIDYILRGYEDLVTKLSSVGANISIIEE